MARPADLHRTVFKRQPGALRAQRRSCRPENLFRHHRPVGKKPPERHRAGPVAPQTVHDRALLFHKSPGQKTPPFCPTLVPKAAGKQIHERNHLHPLDKPIPNDGESSPKTFRNQIRTTTKICVHVLAQGGEGVRRLGETWSSLAEVGEGFFFV